MSPLRCFALLASLLAAASPARAGDFCVDTVAELVQAVNQYDSVSDGLTLSIKIVQGTYVVGNQLANIHSTDGREVGLKLLGGYTAGCTGRVLNAANTVLDGNNVTDSGFGFTLSGDANLIIQGITLTRFRSTSYSALHVGLNVGTSDEGMYQVRHCRFVGNTAVSIVRMAAPQVRFVNNVVAANTLLPGGTAVLLEFTPLADSGVAATNNTIANNSGRGLKISSLVDPSARVSEITNNVLWGNSDADLDLSTFDSLANVLFVNGNTIADSAGLVPPGSGNNASNPQFINPAALNFRPAVNSPAQNSGIGYQTHGIPEKDLDANDRVIGSAIDRGAYESTVDDGTTAFVTTTADNGSNSAPTTGSLRAAIKAANAAGGPYRINFAIGTTCPRIIQMTTNMLDVTGQVTIDARTQNGWNGNSNYGRFDASLCVVLNGSGFTGHAFRVPAGASNASLAVHGLMFAGFTDAAIRLEDGRDHRISGNQFGAVAFTSANGSAVRVTGASRGAFIGGYDDPAAVNLIAGSSNAGVYLDNTLGQNTVANNVIGFQPDGTSAGGNQIGVYLFNSPNNALQYNYISYSAATGITVSGAASSGNQIQYNAIGVAWNDAMPGNTGAGIALNFAAHDNTIGTPILSGFGANQIVASSGPGIWISPSGGARNSALANYFLVNAGLDIDLGSIGPTGNVATNPGTGPNRQQNLPVLTQAIRSTSANAMQINGTLPSAPNAAFRVDVYLDTDCNPAFPDRGRGRVHLGRANVLTNAAGDANLQLTFPGLPHPAFDRASATATSAAGDTSEIGNCIPVTTGSLPEQLFRNGFE